MSIVTLRNVNLSLSELPLLENVQLQIQPNEKIGLIGRNGEGKTSLLNLIAGKLESDSGDVVSMKGLKVGYLAQEVSPEISGTVFSVIQAGGDHLDSHEDYKINAWISRLSLDGAKSFTALSGGLKRKVLFARALINEPDLLLLDEPTNHLDIDSIKWLENLLINFRGCVLFVTHDRVFLGNVATRMIEIDRSRLLSWECDYLTYLQRKEAALIAEEEANKNFDKKLSREEYWVRHGITARRKRNQGRVRRLESLRQMRQNRRGRVGVANLQIQQASASGKIVIEAKKICFSYPHHPGINNFSTTILRGDKIGMIGANGSGKTTLLRLLLKDLQPQSGTIRHGSNLKIAHFDQLRSQLDDNKTLRENVGGGSETVTINGQNKHIMSYLQGFLFSPKDALTPIKKFSGGEKNRVLLAKLFTLPANVFVLDEPTNDLDIETLELLEDRLVNFEGTVLLVSHDRAFLNNIVSSVMVFEKDGGLKEYVGGYDDWQQQSRIQTPVSDNQPIVKKLKREKIKKGKSEYTKQRECKKILKQIEGLERQQADLTEQISSSAFYQQDKEKIVRVQQALQENETALADAYVAWEVLEG